MKPALKWGIAGAAGIAIALAIKNISDESEETAEAYNISNTNQVKALENQIEILQEVVNEAENNKNNGENYFGFLQNTNIPSQINNLISKGYQSGYFFASEDVKTFLPAGDAFVIKYYSNPKFTNSVILIAFANGGTATFRSNFWRNKLPQSLTWECLQMA